VARYRCEHYFLQPWMDARYEQHLQKAIALIHARPQFRLSLQTHKIIDVP
jgi:organic radical activating enzyme